jgi:hypothetical protein
MYEGGARSADIALLARCSVAQFDKIAAHEGWTRGGAAAAIPAPANPALREALAAVETALRDPDLARQEFLRLLDRALALTAAEAPGVERTAQTLTRLASAAAKTKPDETLPAPASGRLIHPSEPVHFPDANQLIEEIARRFEQDANDYLDPRILAILAETVP